MERKIVRLIWIFVAHILISSWLFVLLAIRHFDFMYIVRENFIFTVVLVTLFSFFSTFLGFGKRLFLFIFSSKCIWLTVIIALGVWVQLGVEWLSNLTPPINESFLKYGSFAALFSFPIGILVHMVFEFTPEIENNYIDASLLLISYFISFYLQMYFIARFLSKKRGGERGRRETEE
jgi:hypothetical protein